jgi:uncharacterized membrane protein YdjX (TVP38/TMEM64 family)
LGYVGVFLVVLGINLMPAFGPPTWSVLVLYRLQSRLNPVGLIAVGALAAALGRLGLGYATRAVRDRLSAKRRESLDALAAAITRRRHASVIGLGLFALSPVPSAQLFEAAGLTGMPLPRLVVAFFAGRVVSYTIYVTGASALKGSNVGELLQSSFTDPLGVAVHILFLAALVVVGRIDWRKHLQ